MEEGRHGVLGFIGQMLSLFAVGRRPREQQ
jgi:hypothetical protein